MTIINSSIAKIRREIPWQGKENPAQPLQQGCPDLYSLLRTICNKWPSVLGFQVEAEQKFSTVCETSVGWSSLAWAGSLLADDAY